MSIIYQLLVGEPNLNILLCLYGVSVDVAWFPSYGYLITGILYIRRRIWSGESFTHQVYRACVHSAATDAAPHAYSRISRNLMDKMSELKTMAEICRD